MYFVEHELIKILLERGTEIQNTAIVSICKKDRVSVLLGMMKMYINREKYQ